MMWQTGVAPPCAYLAHPSHRRSTPRRADRPDTACPRLARAEGTRRDANDALEAPREVGLGRESAHFGNGAERKPVLRDQALRVLDPTAGHVTMRRRPGRRLEGAGEMERAEAGLARERLDGQVFTQMGVDELLDPLETPGIECATHGRQRDRRRRRLSDFAACELAGLRPGSRPASSRPVPHRAFRREPPAQSARSGDRESHRRSAVRPCRIDIELPQSRLGQRRCRKVEVETFLDLARRDGSCLR